MKQTGIYISVLIFSFAICIVLLFCNAITIDPCKELVRKYFNKPVIIHCWIRPKVVNCVTSPHNGQDYNKLVGGATHSWHCVGKAVDFHVDGFGCDEVRAALVSKLEQWGLRMEKNVGSNWVHLDIGIVTTTRYFKP